MDTVASLQSRKRCFACSVEGLHCAPTGWSSGIAEDVQRNPPVQIRLSAQVVDRFLHFAKPPVAPLHGVGSGGQELVIQALERLFQIGAKEALELSSNLWEAPCASTQSGQFDQGGLGTAAAVKEPVNLLHNQAERSQRPMPPAQAPEGLLFRGS